MSNSRITTVSERGGGDQLNETPEFIAILGNPKICSAMALAMSIYRTLCVLVLMKAPLSRLGSPNQFQVNFSYS